VLKFWEHSKNLSYLTLHENPWECDCNANDFYHFTHFKSKIIKVSKITCYGKNISEMIWEDFCPPDMTTIYVTVSIAFHELIIGTFGILYWKYQEKIKIWLFVHTEKKIK